MASKTNARQNGGKRWELRDVLDGCREWTLHGTQHGPRPREQRAKPPTTLPYGVSQRPISECSAVAGPEQGPSAKKRGARGGDGGATHYGNPHALLPGAHRGLALMTAKHEACNDISLWIRRDLDVNRKISMSTVGVVHEAARSGISRELLVPPAATHELFSILYSSSRPRRVAASPSAKSRRQNREQGRAWNGPRRGDSVRATAPDPFLTPTPLPASFQRRNPHPP